MGMSKKLGQVAWSSSQGPSFLGQQMGQPADCSAETADTIDSEVKALVERAYRCDPLRLISVAGGVQSMNHVVCAMYVSSPWQTVLSLRSTACLLSVRSVVLVLW